MKNNQKRDNFKKQTKLKLAQRVGYKCSFPKCNRATVGPVLSNSESVNLVGRACHIEAASEGGPRFNPDMTSEDRKSIENGIWCCNIHADIIDNDTELFSVPTLKEWKQLAERLAYEQIDSSDIRENKPYPLIQVGHNIIFKGIWSTINTEKREWEFIIVNYLYSEEKKLDNFISEYKNNSNKNYVVIDSLGYGRLLNKAPVKEQIGTKTYITFTFEPRTEYSNPNDWKDARLSFEDDRRVDLDLFTENGWISGKEAVIQTILMLLGTNQGQWWADEDFGSFLFKYYKDHHKEHDLLQRLIKLEIARKSSIPEGGGLLSDKTSIPISAVKWVDNVKVIGHSENYLEINLKLYFSNDIYFDKNIRVPASLEGYR